MENERTGSGRMAAVLATSAALALGVATSLSCSGGGGGGGTSQGTEGGPCYANQSCNTGLTCASDLCLDTGSGGVSNIDGGKSGSDDGNTIAPHGTLGGACTTDADCEEELTCILPIFAGSTKYCTRSCTDPQDTCQDLALTSYVLGVPLQVRGFLRDPATNTWNSQFLERGTACGDFDGELLCAFVCPALSAAAFDENGEFAGCDCLPGYTGSEIDEGCMLAPDYGCSLFSLQPPDVRDELAAFGIEVKTPECDACNSDMSVTDSLDCHTSRFICSMTSLNFSGQCTEILSEGEVTDCLNASLLQTCDCNCPTPDACDFDLNGKFDNCACCTCRSVEQPPPRPVCDAGSGGAGGASGGAGGASGGAGVGGSAGGLSATIRGRVALNAAVS